MVTFEGSYTRNSGMAVAAVKVVITPDGGEPTTIKVDQYGVLPSTEIAGESFTVEEQIFVDEDSSFTESRKVRTTPGQTVDLSRDVGNLGTLVGGWFDGNWSEM